MSEDSTTEDEDRAREDIGFLLAIVSQLFQSRIGQLLATQDLSYSQFSLLSHLQGVGEPTSISSLADAMEINQPGVTKVVQRLAELELVAVDPDPSDSRRRLVSLGSAATDRLDEIGRLFDADSTDWFDDWTGAQLIEFRDRLGLLTGWLDEHRLP